MKKDYFKFKTIAELNAMFNAEDVARGLVDKVSLRAQSPRRRTEAEKRRAMQVGRLAIMLAADRRA